MNTIVIGYDSSAAADAALEWAAGHAACTAGEVLVVYVASSIAEWELAAAQINTDPVRHEFERRLRDEWTAPLRTAGIPYPDQVRRRTASPTS